ncbi:MAG: L-seryl-tRNA(Sec) selenium transferase, partial [Chloroflexota bacterium]
PETESILVRADEILTEWTSSSLQPVINASGVILHTNLGRAPLSKAAFQAMHAIAQGYSSLEYDLIKGKRGSRYLHSEDLLTRLTGAEAALVVNNNASALLLTLTALSKRRKVLISRTQLIEIGGGFRLPEVMKQSGAILVEIGATNKVNLNDYKKAIKEHKIALMMRAHRSNFRLEGFTGEPELQELTALAKEANIPLLDDLGSGTLIDTARFGLTHEPTIQESLSADADLVCFSGDKLLGGPQAGIIVGRKELIDKLKKHPMARAVRADKLALAALSATLLHYLKDESERKIPIWKMISMPESLLNKRVENWVVTLGQGEIIAGESTVGGGSLPGETLPTHLLAIQVEKADKFLKYLRQSNPPVIARIHEDNIVFDPRTVPPEQEGAMLVSLQNALSVWNRTYSA